MKSRKRWVIGVKCDFPPFGYIDYTGNNRGYDVDVARRFATLAFGRPNRIRLVCVTTPSRIPTLQSSQVDIIVSTLTWTAARAQVDRLLGARTTRRRAGCSFPNNSSINSTRDLAGKTVVTTRGAIYATWMRNCFKNSTLLEVDGTAAAVLAVKEGRADTFMFDDAFLIGVATQDATLKLTNDKFLTVPWGIGIRKGDAAMNRWVNAAIKYMQGARRVRDDAEEQRAQAVLGHLPRQRARRRARTSQYPVGRDPPSECSVAVAALTRGGRARRGRP